MTVARSSDWVRCGLQILRTEGASALTVARLCHALGRTKGSFYHHFRNLEHFVESLLEHWEREHTGDIIEATTLDAPPEVRLRALVDAATHRVDHRLERAMRLWAPRKPQVHDAVRRVDERRLAYLETLFTALPGCAPAARTHARLSYAVLVGDQMLAAQPDLASREAVAALLERCILAPNPTPGGERETP